MSTEDVRGKAFHYVCVPPDKAYSIADTRDLLSDGYHTFRELYRERSALTAALARALRGLGLMAGNYDTLAYKDHDEQPGFDGYRTVLYLKLPTGQVSWHFSDADAAEFLADVP